MMPALLELWNDCSEHVPGSWLRQRGLEEALFTATGFLEPAGWEETELVDDDDHELADAAVVRDSDRAYLECAPGQQVGVGDPGRYRRFRVNRNWLIEHVRRTLADALDEPFVEALGPDLHALGKLDVDGAPVTVYLARRLGDPTVLAASDEALRTHGTGRSGLVLSAVREPFRCIGANVLSPLTDHLSQPEDQITIGSQTLRTAFRNNRRLANGGISVEFIWDGGEVGELFVPGAGTIQIVGFNRLTLIDRLVKAHHRGVSAVKTGDLIEGFGDQSPQNILGNVLWRRLKRGFIRSPDRGLWEIAA